MAYASKLITADADVLEWHSLRHTCLHGEEAREPAEHVLGDEVFPVRVDAQPDVVIQDSLEIAGKPMQDACMRDRERQ